MTAAEGSFLGLAKQSSVGTPNTTDADFQYLLFRSGGVAPNPVILPLDPEVGGGALLRDMVKVGVTSGGALDIIPRPSSLGKFLLGAIGQVTTTNVSWANVLPSTALLVAAQTDYTTGLVNPAAAHVLKVKGVNAGVTLDGDVKIYGTNAADESINETVTLNEDAQVPTIAAFKTVTKVDLPAWDTSGDRVMIGYDDGVYSHVFTLPTDNFAAPYWTLRSAPANIWGEQFQDCRVAGLALSFAGARFVEGAVTFVGGLPTPVATTTWDAAAAVDSGPQFIAPLGDIELPLATNIKVLSGSLAFGLAIPLDEQWIVGSYSPDAMDIVSRSVAITFNIKVTDETLYKKMMYDPDGGSAWVAEMYEEGQIKLQMKSPISCGEHSDTKYQLDFAGHATSNNIVWSAAPIGLRAGRNVIMAVTGVIKATPGSNPFSVTMVNNVASY